MMDEQERETLARGLMDAFAERTGLVGTRPARRYLWTDAFAVGNYLDLWRQCGDERYLQLAVQLVDQVHHVLGRHREDDVRRGWISGLNEADGEQSPTRGGLRIGKPDPEPDVEQSVDADARRDNARRDDAQWDIDGQYFHYLTKWMHALYRMAAATHQQHYLRWAVELAVTAHRAFTFEHADGSKRMVWKMSIDLSRPLIDSMGHHDPLDGLVTILQLQQAARAPSSPGEHLQSDLEPALADMIEMCQTARWATPDPLGAGGLLMDAGWLGQLVFDDGLTSTHGVDLERFLQRLLRDAEASLQAVAASPLLSRSALHRLAFRELGLAIGLHALDGLRGAAASEPPIAALVANLWKYRPLAERIEAYWSDSNHRQVASWSAHQDINDVMLATSLQQHSQAVL